MKFYYKSPFILLLVLFLNSCTEKTDAIVYSELNNSDITKVKSYYKKAQKYNDSLNKGIVFIDSAITLAKDKQINLLYLKSIGYKTILFSRHNDYSNALLYSDSLLLEAKRLKDTFYLAKAYYKKGFYNDKLNKTVKSFNNYVLSKKYFIQLNDSNQIAGKLLNMAIIQKNIGDYNAAKATVVEGLEFQKGSNAKKYKSKLYNTLSIIKKEEKEYEKSLEYKDLSISLLKKKNDLLSIKDSITLSRYLNSKAVVYSKIGDYSKAIQILNEVNNFPIINDKNQLIEKARILDNIGVVKGELNDKDAEGVLLKTYRIRDSLNDKPGLNASLIHLCKFYLDEKEFDKALPWAERAYANSIELKSLVAQKEALDYITELQSVPQKKYINAYKKVSDSLTLLSNQVRKIYAEEKYEAHEYK